MYSSLSKDLEIEFEDGSKAIVTNDIELGSGGQGIVYPVKYNDEIFAFKWYTEESCFTAEYKDSLRKLAKFFSSKKMFKSFIAPIKLSISTEEGQFGYLMKLIPSNYVSLRRILSGREQFESMLVEAQACLNLINELAKFHNYNYSFMDINDGSFFFDIKDGSVLICDCDNVVEPGKTTELLFGTPGYKAPELYFKDSEVSKYTDFHSVAVILFKMLMRDDPFVGQGTGTQVASELKRIYGLEPIFTLDPENDSNRPFEPYVEESWNMLTPAFKQEFIKTFTKGTKNPEMRSSINEWSGLLQSYMAVLEDKASNPETADEVRRRRPLAVARLLTIFVVDVSNSMRGKKIDEVNEAIRQTVKTLSEFEEKIPGVRIDLALLTFSNGSEWVTPTPQHVIEYEHTELIPSGRFTDFNCACMDLDMRLVKNDLLNFRGPKKPTVIILISDGQQVKKYYEEELQELRCNYNFSESIRLAIGLDTEDNKSDYEMLKCFTMNSDEDEDPNMVVQMDAVQSKISTLISDLTTHISMAAFQQPTKVTDFGSGSKR